MEISAPVAGVARLSHVPSLPGLSFKRATQDCRAYASLVPARPNGVFPAADKRKRIYCDLRP